MEHGCCIFLNDTRPTEIYTLSLHDALPISTGLYETAEPRMDSVGRLFHWTWTATLSRRRSEEHTSELQSRVDLVCRLLLEKKNSINPPSTNTYCARAGTTTLSPRCRRTRRT